MKKSEIDGHPGWKPTAQEIMESSNAGFFCIIVDDDAVESWVAVDTLPVCLGTENRDSYLMTRAKREP